MLSREDLEKARAERTPVIALRPDSRYPEELDDIVVKDVEMFRAEAMSDDNWWMACYFRNGERLAFQVAINKKPKRIAFYATEWPRPYIDLDSGETIT